MHKLLLLIIFLTSNLFAETIFTYMSKEDKHDKRKDYNTALLKLSLDKTTPTYGTYKLVPTPKMNHARARKTAFNNELKNFIFKDSVSTKRTSDLAYIPFPVDRGIVGYRVFFVSPEAKERLKEVTSLEDLKKFTFLQGLGWLDTKILRRHGFTVYEGNNYKGLFGMVAKDRADIFPRGVNELFSEYQAYKNIKNLTYDTSLVLYYPLPRFFFSNKANKKALKRVHEGIMMAYEDGSLIELWNSYYKDNLDFVNLKKRKIFKITNPFLDGIDTSYEKYIYKP
jgi:hypothetical protein